MGSQGSSPSSRSAGRKSFTSWPKASTAVSRSLSNFGNWALGMDTTLMAKGRFRFGSGRRTKRTSVPLRSADRCCWNLASSPLRSEWCWISFFMDPSACMSLSDLRRDLRRPTTDLRRAPPALGPPAGAAFLSLPLLSMDMDLRRPPLESALWRRATDPRRFLPPAAFSAASPEPASSAAADASAAPPEPASSGAADPSSRGASACCCAAQRAAAALAWASWSGVSAGGGPRSRSPLRRFASSARRFALTFFSWAGASSSCFRSSAAAMAAAALSDRCSAPRLSCFSSGGGRASGGGAATGMATRAAFGSSSSDARAEIAATSASSASSCSMVCALEPPRGLPSATSCAAPR